MDQSETVRNFFSDSSSPVKIFVDIIRIRVTRTISAKTKLTHVSFFIRRLSGLFGRDRRPSLYIHTYGCRLKFVLVRIDRSVPCKQTDPNEITAVDKKKLYIGDISRYSTQITICCQSDITLVAGSGTRAQSLHVRTVVVCVRIWLRSEVQILMSDA